MNKGKSYIESLNNDDHLEKIILDNYKWKFALENSNIGVWDWNAETNEVFYSEESKKMIGFEDFEFGNSSEEWDKRVHKEDREAYYRDFNAHLNGELNFYKNEHRILCKDGTYKWILDRGKIVSRDNNGKPLRIIGTHADISKRKEIEEQLRTNLNLITNQNKRLHNFTHIVSHNLRTHIGNLENILEFYDQANSEDEKEEMINHLKTISKSLTDTITDLNGIISIKSKSDTQELNERVNIKSCVDKVIKSFDLDIQKSGVRINNSIREDIFLTTNVSYLESIIHNLISNGIKYRNNKHNSHISFLSKINKESIQLIISDNGIGIDLEKYGNQIFQLYQTFHGLKKVDSKGIGLYVTKTQVESIGATIDVFSKLNEGTSFTITFPK